MLQRGLNRTADDSSTGRGSGKGGAEGIFGGVPGLGGFREGPCDSTTGVGYPPELLKVRTCERGVHLDFNAETGSLILLAIRCV